MLREGIELDDGPTAPAQAEVIRCEGSGYRMEAHVRLCIHEGRKRQVRRMLRTIGHPVRMLKRISFAGLTLEDLEEGAHRTLSMEETRALRTQVGL
jgi:23S rRNA pseudouridine2605 synthase